MIENETIMLRIAKELEHEVSNVQAVAALLRSSTKQMTPEVADAILCRARMASRIGMILGDVERSAGNHLVKTGPPLTDASEKNWEHKFGNVEFLTHWGISADWVDYFEFLGAESNHDVQRIIQRNGLGNRQGYLVDFDSESDCFFAYLPTREEAERFILAVREFLAEKRNSIKEAIER